MERQIDNVQPDEIMLPAPTAWPFAFALGVALLLAGLLTNVSISILGAILYLGVRGLGLMGASTGLIRIFGNIKSITAPQRGKRF